MNISTVETTTSRDHIITTMLGESEKMIRNLALKFHMDAEDCIQEAACEMLEAYDKIPTTCTNKKAYLNRCIRNRIVELRKKRFDALSMDMPLEKGPHETLAETFVAPEHCRDTTQVDYIIDTIHAALHESCMLDEQLYAVHIYGMNAFTPVAPAKLRTGVKGMRNFTKSSEMGNVRKGMLTALRKHPRVLKLIQREKCGAIGHVRSLV